MIVAIAGASGLTGSLCLQLLLHHPQVEKVIAIGRSALQVTHTKLQQVLLSQPEMIDRLNVDAFISCLGTTIKKAGSQDAFIQIDRTLPVSLATQLHKQGCRTCAVVSSMGSSAQSNFFYTRIKGEMEEDLKAIGFQSLHILRPSIIDGSRGESRPGERVALFLTKMCHPLMWGSLKHYKAIPATTIAAALVQCITQNAKGQFTYLSHTIKEMTQPD